MKLVFATNNNHKLQEIRSMLPESYELLSLADIGCYEELPETHESMEENAVEKAMYLFQKYGYPCFADDSGLEVEALGGNPGVYSARYGGEERNSEKNISKLLYELKDTTNRKARFKTVIAFIQNQQPVLFEGVVYGNIIETPAGHAGFGYDPVFMPDGYTISFAEMPMEEKNKISHRAKAFTLLINFLKGTSGFY